MEQRDIEIKNAIDDNDISRIIRLIRVHKLPWINTPFITIEGEKIHREIKKDFYVYVDRTAYTATPLYYAVTRNAYDAVVALISEGAEIDAFANGYETVLHRAIFLALPDIAKYILACGADMDKQQLPNPFTDRLTPLHITAHFCLQVPQDLGFCKADGEVRNARKKIAKYLLRMGANTELLDQKNLTPLRFAEFFHRYEIQITLHEELAKSQNFIEEYKRLGIGTATIQKEKVRTLILKDPARFLSLIRDVWQINKWQYAFLRGMFDKPVEIVALLKPLNRVERLISLDLSGKGIDDTTVHMVIWLLKKNCFLRSLDLQNNNLTAEGLKLLTFSIIAHPELELINLQNNPAINSQSIDILLDSLNNNHRLLAIHLPSGATEAQKTKCDLLCFRNQGLSKKLIEFSSTGNFAGVQELVHLGVNVHYKQEAALINAVLNHHANIAVMLLRNGSNMYVVGTDGVTAHQVDAEAQHSVLKQSDSHFYVCFQLARVHTLQQAADLNIPIAQLLALFGQFSSGSQRPVLTAAPESEESNNARPI